jgi:hypothetical protein
MSPSRVSVAVACVLLSTVAGCSSHSPGIPPASTSTAAPVQAASTIQVEITGVGATRANWDAYHVLNPASSNGADYGNDPSLAAYLTDNGAVYRDVDDSGTDRVHGYALALHTIDAQQALRQLRQELPADATVAWDLPLDRCYRVAFNSPSLQAAGKFMAEAQLQYIQPDGTPATSPDRFNLASIWLEDVGSPPDPEKGC